MIMCTFSRQLSNSIELAHSTMRGTSDGFTNADQQTHNTHLLSGPRTRHGFQLYRGACGFYGGARSPQHNVSGAAGRSSSAFRCTRHQYLERPHRRSFTTRLPRPLRTPALSRLRVNSPCLFILAGCSSFSSHPPLEQRSPSWRPCSPDTPSLRSLSSSGNALARASFLRAHSFTCSW